MHLHIFLLHPLLLLPPLVPLYCFRLSPVPSLIPGSIRKPLIDTMLDKGDTVHILNMGIMDNTPTGKLIRTIMLAFAEFERDMIVERTQEGKAIARQKEDFKEGSI